MTHDEFMRRMRGAVLNDEGSDVVDNMVLDRANTIQEAELDRLSPGWRDTLPDGVEFLNEIDRDDIAERESEYRHHNGIGE